MGIAYAQHHQIYAQFRSDTAQHMIDDIDAIVTSAGWTNKVAVTNGWKYSLLSPQGLTCKVLIHDNGARIGPLSVSAISIQLMSNDELSVGMEHHLVYGVSAYVALGYQIIVGYTQFFISIPGIDSGSTSFATAHSVSGGIPRVPDGTDVDCTAEGFNVISQLWWSCASGDDGVRFNFRDHLFCSRFFSYNLNGVVFIGSAGFGPQDGSLQIYSIAPTYNLDLPGTSVPLTVYYGSGQALDIDAFVGWAFSIYGQIWDAFLRTKADPLDGVYVTTEVDEKGVQYQVTWKAYNSTPFGTLYLRIDEPSPKVDDGWNYAY